MGGDPDLSIQDYPFSGLAIRVWPYSGFACSGSLPFRSVCSGLSAFQFAAVPICPCSGLIASLGTPSFLTRFRPHHTPTSPPYSAQSCPVRHHSVTFRAAHHSADSTPLPLFPPRLSCRMPSHCVALTCPAIFHTRSDNTRPQDSTPFNALFLNENRRY